MASASMMMAYGAYFLASGPVNLMPDAYPTSASGWDFVDNSANATYNQTDESGGSNATLYTFTTDTSHQIWENLNASLQVNQAYSFRAYMKAGAAGYSGEAQMAYYSGGDAVNEKDVPSLSSSFVEYEFKFIAGEDINSDPSMRLVGYSGGLINEEVVIGKVTLNKIDTSGSPTEILTDTQFYSGDAWNNNSGSSLTYNQTDSQGGSTAALIDLIGPDNHQIEQILSEPLVEGDAYTLSCRVKAGPNGYPGNFQIAYYDDGSSVNSREFALTTEWQTVSHRFFAGAATVEPAVRIIGFSNGSDGNQIVIEAVSLSKGTTSLI